MNCLGNWSNVGMLKATMKLTHQPTVQLLDKNTDWWRMLFAIFIFYHMRVNEGVLMFFRCFNTNRGYAGDYRNGHSITDLFVL